MRAFHHQQRIRIAKPDHAHRGMEGWTGTVARIRMGDNGAWVEMDRDLPRDLQSFPAGDDRHRHILLFPDECKPAKEPKA